MHTGGPSVASTSPPAIRSRIGGGFWVRSANGVLCRADVGDVDTLQLLHPDSNLRGSHVSQLVLDGPC